MKTRKFDTKRMVMLALLTGVLLVMSYTPLGYLNIGPLAISLNMIPVAIAAVALGPSGGAVLGAVFGITSCLQCIGVGGVSQMGAILFEINPLLCFAQRLIPRILAGWLAGVVFVCTKKLCGSTAGCCAAGFAGALLNTVLFMGALVLFFGNTPYLQEMIAGRNVVLFICGFIGINAVVEMLASTFVVGAVCKALEKAKLIGGK